MMRLIPNSFSNLLLIMKQPLKENLVDKVALLSLLQKETFRFDTQ